MPIPLINLKNITKDYQNGDVITNVLKGVSFEINNGDYGGVGIGKVNADVYLRIFGRADKRGILF